MKGIPSEVTAVSGGGGAAAATAAAAGPVAADTAQLPHAVAKGKFKCGVCTELLCPMDEQHCLGWRGYS